MSNKLNFFHIIVMFFAINFLLSVGNLKAEHLVEVINKAFENNYEYKSAVEKYNSNAIYKDIGVTYLLPKLDLSASTSFQDSTRKYKSSQISGSNTTSSPYGFDLTLVQPLYNAQAWSYYNTTKLMAEQARITLDKDKNSIILKVVQYYLEVLDASNDYDYIKTQEETLSAQLNEITRKAQLGQIKRIDIEEVNAKHAAVLSMKISYENNREVAIDRLNKFLNYEVNNFQKIKDNIDGIFTDNSSVLEWQNITANTNLDLLNMRLSLQLADESISNNKASYYPTLSLIGKYSNNNSADSSRDKAKYSDNTKYIGLSLNMNLFSGGGTMQSNKQLKYKKNEVAYQLMETENNIKTLTMQYYLNVYHGMEQINALKQSLDSAEKFLRAAERSYEVGLKTTTDVLIANQSYFDAARNFSRAKSNFILSILSLKAISGVISNEDIMQINSYFQ